MRERVDAQDLLKRQIDKKRFWKEVGRLYRSHSLDMPKMMYVDSP